MAKAYELTGALHLGPQDKGSDTGPNPFRTSWQAVQKLNITENPYILVYAPRQQFFVRYPVPYKSNIQKPVVYMP